MASPEGTFVTPVDLSDLTTIKHIHMLDGILRTFLVVHAYPEMLSMEVEGSAEDRREFTNGGLLAPAGVTPKLELKFEDDAYYFRAALVDPSRTTTTIVVNEVEANLPQHGVLDLLSVCRTFIPKPDIDGRYLARKPGSHELSASAAIISVARATDRLSREHAAVTWTR